MAARATGGVQSVDRAFDLLELMADAGGTRTLSELAASTELPPPTIHRLLQTLVGGGYVRQLPNRSYALGPKLIRLGNHASGQLAGIAEPFLRSLVSELHESANLAVLDRDMILYVGQVPSPHSMRMFTEIGRRVHAHDSGVGKAILSQLAEEQVRGIVGRVGMPSATEHSIRTPDALVEHLDLIRNRGYSIDDNEQELGVRCYAVPVIGAPTPTAVSVSGPETRVTDAFGERAVPALQRAAEGLAAELNRTQ